jgi:hypothetical protein
MDKVQETTFSDYNAPSSESFRLYVHVGLLGCNEVWACRFSTEYGGSTFLRSGWSNLPTSPHGVTAQKTGMDIVADHTLPIINYIL